MLGNREYHKCLGNPQGRLLPHSLSCLKSASHNQLSPSSKASSLPLYSFTNDPSFLRTNWISSSNARLNTHRVGQKIAEGFFVFHSKTPACFTDPFTSTRSPIKGTYRMALSWSNSPFASWVKQVFINVQFLHTSPLITWIVHCTQFMGRRLQSGTKLCCRRSRCRYLVDLQLL